MERGVDPTLLREAWTDLWRIWPELALTDLLVKGCGVVLVVPATTLALKLFLVNADDGVLTDADIARFLLHPFGLLAGLAVGAVWIGLTFGKSGALMVLGFSAAEGRRLDWVEGLRYLGRHGRHVLTLAARVLTAGVILAAPFLFAGYSTYVRLLGSHDINFYLANRPPEFRAAVWIVGGLALVFAALALWLLSGWILGLPFVLFGRAPGKLALRESAARIGARRGRVAALLVGWGLGIAAAQSGVTAVVGILGSWLVPDFGGSMTRLALGLGFTTIVAFLLQVALGFIATAHFALMLVRLFRRIAGPGSLQPAPAGPGSTAKRLRWRFRGKAPIAVIAVVTVAVLTGGDGILRSFDRDEHPVAIAHRGASAAAPENTIAAFERAIAEGADFIELDVQENADGVVVVAHDSDFMKIGGSSLKVWEATAADLHDLDVGSWFGPAFADQRVATLEQVLELARGRIDVVIELKYYGHDERLEARVVEIVERTKMQDHIKLMSLKRDGLRRAAALRPDWPRGLLNTVAVGDLTRLQLDFLALNATAAKRSTIRRAHARGIQVYVWTVNDPVQMSVMLSRGVDGIITDRPATVREVVELRDDLGPFGRFLLWVAGETGLLHIAEAASTAEEA